MSRAVGTIGALSRFAVKSMLGEQLDSVELTSGGVVGDRAYAIVDRDTGKVASAKHPKLWPDLLACRARFTGEPRAGEDAPPVLIELADGTAVMSDAPDADALLSRFFGRNVALSRSAPADYTIDEYVPDVDGVRPGGERDELTEQKLGAAFFNERGLPSVVPEGSFFDLFPLSVMTTSTIAHLEALQPGSRFDARRFRMNLIVDTPEAGFAENAWLERTLAVGDDVELVAAIPLPRCVMTNLAQEDLPRDPLILKTLAQHNRLDVIDAGRYPCAGIYALPTAAGTIRAGDTVTLKETPAP